MTRIAVVDYGAGNVQSVVKALAAVDAAPVRAIGPSPLSGADAIVIPGVGHFGATRALDDRWRAAIATTIDAGTPLLGICLGMQWLFDGSDEAAGDPGSTHRDHRDRGGRRAAGVPDRLTLDPRQVSGARSRHTSHQG